MLSPFLLFDNLTYGWQWAGINCLGLFLLEVGMGIQILTLVGFEVGSGLIAPDPQNSSGTLSSVGNTGSQTIMGGVGFGAAHVLVELDTD